MYVLLHFATDEAEVARSVVMSFCVHDGGAATHGIRGCDHSIHTMEKLLPHRSFAFGLDLFELSNLVQTSSR